MELPLHVATAIGTPQSVSESELLQALDSWGATQATFGLSPEEFVASLVASTSGNYTFTTRGISRAPQSWQYIEVSYAGVSAGVAVCTLVMSRSAPATAIGELMVKAWIAESSLISNTYEIVPGKLIYGEPSPRSLGTYVASLCAEWANACLLFEGSLLKPSWTVGNQLAIGPDARIIQTQTAMLKYQQIFLEAVAESKLKWRFLSLYRIFEHGYLVEVFETIKRDFFSTPKESLDAAIIAVSSEIKQFTTLVNTASLTSQFEQVFDEFQIKLAAGNRFSVALENSMRQSGQIAQNNNRWQRGVLVIYKIRCAIVHAGLSAPIYDSYVDSSELLEALIPAFELIALNFLGIVIT